MKIAATIDYFSVSNNAEQNLHTVSFRSTEARYKKYSERSSGTEPSFRLPVDPKDVLR